MLPLSGTLPEAETPEASMMVNCFELQLVLLCQQGLQHVQSRPGDADQMALLLTVAASLHIIASTCTRTFVERSNMLLHLQGTAVATGMMTAQGYMAKTGTTCIATPSTAMVRPTGYPKIPTSPTPTTRATNSPGMPLATEALKGSMACTVSRVTVKGPITAPLKP